MSPIIQPTNVEKKMREQDFIVSKTDLEGRITYCNKIFIEFSKYSEEEFLGKQHNIVRHPDMPRCIFKYLWETIKNKQEVNVYIKNLAKDGSFYWVHANVTPTINHEGELQGYYSVRRKPNERRLKKVKEIYNQLLAEEKKYDNSKGLEESYKLFKNLIKSGGKNYEEFIFSL